MVSAFEFFSTNLRAWWTLTITTTASTWMLPTISHPLAFPLTHHILTARNLFLRSSTSTRLSHHNPTSLKTRTTVTPLRTPMIPTPKNFITSPTTQRRRNITRQPLIKLLPTGTTPLPLIRTQPTLSTMTPSLAHMFPTVKLTLTRTFTPKHPLAAILLLLHLPTTASINRALPARRTLAVVANLSTAMDLTIQDLITNLSAGEELVSTSTNVFNAAAEAFGFNELRTRGTRTRMTQ